jgi:prevent-host-death family protein
MYTITATEAKNNLARLMESAIKEPVVIEKNGRPYVVVMSVDDYEKTASSRKKQAFVKLCKELANTSKNKGMTPKLLDVLLKNKR